MDVDCITEVVGVMVFATDVSPPPYIKGSEECSERYDAIEAWMSGTNIKLEVMVEE